MPEQNIVNGVDVDQLNCTICAVKDNAALAHFKFRASNKWISGGHCRTTIKDFYGAGQEDTSRSEAFVLEADEPAVLQGEDHGPSATEAALYALTSCLNTSLIYHAAAKGIKIDELEINAEGTLDLRGFLGLSEEVRNGFQNVKVTFKVKSDAPERKIEELVELAQKRSPVFDMFSTPVPISVELEAISAVAAEE